MRRNLLCALRKEPMNLQSPRNLKSLKSLKGINIFDVMGYHKGRAALIYRRFLLKPWSGLDFWNIWLFSSIGGVLGSRKGTWNVSWWLPVIGYIWGKWDVTQKWLSFVSNERKSKSTIKNKEKVLLKYKMEEYKLWFKPFLIVKW